MSKNATPPKTEPWAPTGDFTTLACLYPSPTTIRLSPPRTAKRSGIIIKKAAYVSRHHGARARENIHLAKRAGFCYNGVSFEMKTMRTSPFDQYYNGSRKYPWLWDTDMGNDRFDEYLTQTDLSSEKAQWAMARLIDYAPYLQLMRRLPQKRFLEIWPQISRLIRPRSIRDGMDFYFSWLKQQGGSSD